MNVGPLRLVWQAPSEGETVRYPRGYYLCFDANDTEVGLVARRGGDLLWVSETTSRRRITNRGYATRYEAVDELVRHITIQVAVQDAVV